MHGTDSIFIIFIIRINQPIRQSVGEVIMTALVTPASRLLERANEARCAQCPPERVCAWACVQGINRADAIAGAVLEQSHSWARQAPVAGLAAVQQALWEMYNG
ncbi:MAG: hypothetical protein Kow00106_10700 [Anaerolineae bacterium]